MIPRNFNFQATPQISTLDRVVDAVSRKTQAPVLLVHSCALAVASVVFQNRYVIEVPEVGTRPLSLYMLAIAESGERKSTVYDLLAKPIREFEAQQRLQSDVLGKKYQTEHEIWEERTTHLRKKAVKDPSFTKELDEHIKAKPLKPVAKRLLHSDVSPQAIPRLLAENRSIGLFSDEAAGKINGNHAMGDLTLVNTLWGGRMDSAERVESSLSVDDPRLSMMLMLQPKAFKKLLEIKGESLRDVGFFSRFYVCYPQSTQGNRYIDKSQPLATQSNAALEAFYDRLKGELEASALGEVAGAEKNVLKLTPEATDAWINYFNEIEGRIGYGGDLVNFRDYASKEAEKVARLSALLHLIEGRQGDIALDMLNLAIDFSRMYLDEFKRLLHVPTEQEILTRDAEELYNTISRRFREKRITSMPKREIVNFCNNKFRKNRAYLNQLVDALHEERWLFTCYVIGSSGKRTEHITLDSRNEGLVFNHSVNYFPNMNQQMPQQQYLLNMNQQMLQQQYLPNMNQQMPQQQYLPNMNVMM